MALRWQPAHGWGLWSPWRLDGNALHSPRDRSLLKESASPVRSFIVAARDVCTASALASLLVAARGRRRHRCSVMRKAGGEEDAAALEAEAARIRAEADAMQLEVAAQRRRLQAADLLQGASKLSRKELQVRLKESGRLTLSDTEVGRLLKLLGDTTLGQEELESEAFQAALQKLEQEQAKQQREEEIAEKAAADGAQEGGQIQPSDWIGDTLSQGAPGDDRSWAIRAAAVLGYLLPLVDSLPFGFPIASMAPFTVPLFNFLIPLFMVKDAIPFGTFIFILLLSALSRNSSFPRLLQFNWQQAVVMDVLAIMPGFITGLLGLELPEDLLLAAFVLLFGSVVYCVIWTALGISRESLPTNEHTPGRVEHCGGVVARS